MIDRIKRKIKEFENRFRTIDTDNKNNRKLQDLILTNQQSLYCASQLNQLFSNSEYIPNTEWSLSPITIVHILNDIFLDQKQNIVEFGCGSSSLYIAKFLEYHGVNSKFNCIESDEEWLKKIKCLAEQYKISQFINFIYAPITEVEKQYSLKDQKTWYDIATVKKALKNMDKIDLVVVDGPVGVSSPYARYSAVPTLKDKFTNNISIFLDDTFRKEEMEIIKEWKKTLGLEIFQLGKYSVLSQEKSFSSKPLLFPNGIGQVHSNFEL